MDTKHTTVRIDFDFAGVPEAELIDLYAASQQIPGRTPGLPINYQVLQRYASESEGCPCGPPGAPRVYLVLPTLWRGCKRYTHAKAVEAWKAKRDELNRPAPAEKPRTPGQQARGHKRALKQLAGAGYGRARK